MWFPYGGVDSIKKDHPILLILIYHTEKDFFEIPSVIKAHAPGYGFKFSRSIILLVIG
ncbi:hypothetical protein T231_03445 [Tannerella sp. oral taxon BU063 isolate Cell 6/7/9]|uniref:Uncharacterized protein n=2 Tax=Tannerella serpentiformis TaxID=712710 RepID=W2CUG8_9BACT|nr:hypothetical protein N425_00600 [Tannerella sp. oral taxon BU063 isolate Cell 2]ETK10708.1 hypothetical protein T231_03445 [Tannerella sp. oral taxon BU063 isolate Cell 6/7/9]